MNPNPYVGPRPFFREDQALFFGRESEGEALEKLIVAQRGVLLFSPAGAGKTSLLNARVAPALAARGLKCLPMARAGAPFPPGIKPGEVKNRYVYGALLSLFGEQVDPGDLLDQTLQSGLRILLNEAPISRETTQPPRQVVIFDQVEELLTASLRDGGEARGFFDQLRDALAGMPHLGVILSLRETSLAELAEYLGPVSGEQPWAQFHLRALSMAGALEAITRPAELAGVPFAEGQAESLVEALRQASGLTQTPSGAQAAVDPLLLQVVCNHLWANLPDGAQAVSAAGLPRSAGALGLDEALTDYYETAVRAASLVGHVAEGEVRCWFSQQLITPQGTRAMVSQGLLETGGLSNLAVVELEDRCLVISHAWAGGRWYELAQERLIEPIRASNQAWERSRETPLRLTARRWQATGERGLLYRGGALKTARAWAESAALNGPEEVEPSEWAFIQASEKAAHSQATLHRWILVGGLVLLLLVMVMGLVTSSSRYQADLASRAQATAQAERATAVMAVKSADQQWAAAAPTVEAAQHEQDEAQRQALISASHEYAARASQALDQNRPMVGLLLALQSLRKSAEGGETRSVTGEQALRDGLGQVSGIPLQGHRLSVNNLAGSPNGRWLATVSDDGSLRLWDLTALDPGKQSILLDPGRGWLSAVTFSPDGRWLAASGADTVIRVWEMTPADAASSLDQAAERLTAQSPILLEGHTSSIEGLRFSPDGHWLISGSADKTVRLWDATRLPEVAQPVTLTGPSDIITLLVVSDDGRWLAAGGRDGGVWLWDLQAADVAASARSMALDDRINDLTFSPDGRWLAAGGLDQRVVLWDVHLADPGAQPFVLGQHPGGVLSLAFSPDGCWLASGGADGRAFLWSMGVQGSDGPSGEVFYALPWHTGAVNSLAFPPIVGPLANDRTTRLFSGGADNTVRVWDLSPVAVESQDCRRPVDANGQVQAMPDARTTLIQGMTLRGLDGPVLKVAVAGARWLAAAGADASARLWDLAFLQPGLDPFLFDTTGVGRIYASAISPDGRWLAAAGQSGAFVWSLRESRPAPQAVGCIQAGAYALAAAPGVMAAGCLDGSVVVWPTAQNRGLNGGVQGGWQNGSDFLPERLEGLEGVVYSVALSPDGQWLAAGDGTGRLLAWRLVEGVPKGAAQELMAGGSVVYDLVFDPQGRWLVSADAQGRLRLWDPADDMAALATFQVSAAPVYTLAVSSDGRWLAAGTWDRPGVVRLWDMRWFKADSRPAGEPAAFTLTGFINRVYALTFSPDGRWLAAGSADFTLRQWDLTALAQLDPAQMPQPDPKAYSSLLDDHHDMVFQAVYSLNSRWLFSASVDGTIRQWDAQNPAALPVVFSGHTAWVRALSLTADGRYLISASEDGTLRRWTLSLDDLQRQACQATRRDLTAAEVARYLHGAAAEPVCARYGE